MSYHGVVNPAAHQTRPWIQSPSQQLSFDQCSLQYKLTWISDAILDIKCPNFLQQSELILHFWRRPTCQTPNNWCSNSCIQKLSSEINYFIKDLPRLRSHHGLRCSVSSLRPHNHVEFQAFRPCFSELINISTTLENTFQIHSRTNFHKFPYICWILLIANSHNLFISKKASPRTELGNHESIYIL